jgi:UDP-N-acetylmuramoyl-L-alanyl-D-glutamate--2,6-diaminopimelate ligase
MSLRQTSASVSLHEIFPQNHFLASRDLRFSSCTSDPRRCRRGGLYVALQTPEFDGHDYATQAVRRGAVAVVAERRLPIDAPVLVVPDSREAFGWISHHLKDLPCRCLRTIAVTGTNGKTTTSLLIQSVLKAAGLQTGTLNDLVFDDGTSRQAVGEAIPSAPVLAESLARMRTAGCTHAVLETSSQMLSRRDTAGLELDAAVVTNVRRDHVDFHGSIINYRRAKARLFEHLKPGGFVVANADDPATRFLLRNVSQPVLTVGMRMPAELTATLIERCAGEQTFLLNAGNETAAVQTAMFGDHHIYNCLSAAAIGLVLGIDLTTIARGLEAVTWIPGRMEPLGCGQPFGVYVDDAHTPDALAVTLKALRNVTSGRVICVFGADADRDPACRPLLGRVVERTADLGIITNDNPRGEQPLQIAHDIIDGYDRPAKAHILPDRAEAIRWALGEAGPGDAVLIAGKGDRQYQTVGDQQRPFDDREVARQWLCEVGARIEYEPLRPATILRFPTGAPAVN